MLRQDLGMPPPGDIRNCMEALANTEPVMRELLHYRFTEGSLAGQSFGNLFLAALNGISPSFDVAVSRMSEVLAVTGRVLPVTTADVQLEAEFENGATVVGESKIFYCKKQEDCRIRQVRLVPAHPKALPAALSAIGAGKKTLIILEDNNPFAVKSANNIAGVKTAQVNTINTYDILNANTLVIVKGAVSKIEEVYA